MLLRRLTPPVRRERSQTPPEATSHAEDEQEEEAEPPAQNRDIPETSERPNVPKREKFDSGVVDDVDTGKGLTSSDEDNETNGTSLLCQTTSDEEDMDVESDSDSVEFLKSEDEGVEEDLIPEPKKGSGSKREKNEPEYTTYSSVMKEKINLLPLPPILKTYVNLDREF